MASHLPSFITPWLAKQKKSAGKKSFNGHTALYTYIISNQASTSAREQHTLSMASIVRFGFYSLNTVQNQGYKLIL